jgi:hypothetical protein
MNASLMYINWRSEMKGKDERKKETMPGKKKK